RGLPLQERHPPHVRMRYDARAAVVRILQIGEQRGLLGAAAAAIAAVAAGVVLGATLYVARQQAVVPAAALQAANQNRVAGAGAGGVGRDVDALRHGVET